MDKLFWGVLFIFFLFLIQHFKHNFFSEAVISKFSCRILTHMIIRKSAFTRLSQHHIYIKITFILVVLESFPDVRWDLLVYSL